MAEPIIKFYSVFVMAGIAIEFLQAQSFSLVSSHDQAWLQELSDAEQNQTPCVCSADGPSYWTCLVPHHCCDDLLYQLTLTERCVSCSLSPCQTLCFTDLKLYNLSCYLQNYHRTHQTETGLCSDLAAPVNQSLKSFTLMEEQTVMLWAWRQIYLNWKLQFSSVKFSSQTWKFWLSANRWRLVWVSSSFHI